MKIAYYQQQFWVNKIAVATIAGLAAMTVIPAFAAASPLDCFFSGLPDRTAVNGSINRIHCNQGQPEQLTGLTPDRAIAAVLTNPKVQQKIESLGDRFGGLSVGRMPSSEQPYYIVELYVWSSDRMMISDTFRVSSDRGAIAVQDIRSGRYIALEDWQP